MCTVTYLPRADNTFILTHNRDEQLSRGNAIPPEMAVINNRKCIYPMDPKGSGTWIGVREDGMVACLLNGGFDKHIPDPPYKHSRGLIILKLFELKDLNKLLEFYDFNGIEPFTLIVKEQNILMEVVWDGSRLFPRNLDAEAPHIYSSTTLYNEESRLKRSIWFLDWLQLYPDYDVKDIRCFHNYGGEGDTSIDLVMQRDNSLRTVSITSIECNHHRATTIYHDLVTDEYTTTDLPLT
jgi:hypothetical protein